MSNRIDPPTYATCDECGNTFDDDQLVDGLTCRPCIADIKADMAEGAEDD